MEDKITVTLPKLGESILGATVVRWFKHKGDEVRLDEPLLEVSTDKVNSEIPSPVAGTLIEILAEADQELEIGAPLAIIQTGEGEKGDSKAHEPTPLKKAVTVETDDMTDFYSPSVMRLAKEKGLSLEELKKIPHSGLGGRLTKKDIENYQGPSKKEVSSSQGENIERVKMTAMRKAIADNMVRSFYEAPHASLVTEVDVTEIMNRIAKEKESFFQKYQVKLSITSLVAHGITKAIEAYPLINSALEGDTIVMKRYVHLGIAVSVEQGVMVPVIKNCEKRNVPEIAWAVQDLAQKARSHALDPQEVQEGTVTMTNFGMTGTLIGIPIIRYPEVAIIGLGAVQEKVVPKEGGFAIRKMMHVTLTFDHRVLDGMYGCGFLQQLKKILETDKPAF